MLPGLSIHKRYLSDHDCRYLLFYLKNSGITYHHVKAANLEFYRAFSGPDDREKAKFVIDYLRHRNVDKLMPFDDVTIVHYRNQNDWADYHQDNTHYRVANTPTGVVSLGESRIISFRDFLSKEILFEESLNNGDVLVMDSAFQDHYEHGVLSSLEPKEERFAIALGTFKA